MKSIRYFIFVVAILLIGFSQNSSAHGCSSYSQYSYDWAGHTNWFMGRYITSFNQEGILINMNTLKVDTVTSKEGSIGAFEGTSIVSDDHENVLFYTNGRNVYSGIDSSVKISYTGLLQGNEGGSNPYGSAAQGVITVRHPLNTNQYHVFTTDDAISTNNGLNHFVLDNKGTLISGPTKLGTYTSSEGIAATMHANGSDIWVATTDAAGYYNTYLITCNGLDTVNSNLNQAGGKVLSGNVLRGGMTFSWNRKKLAVAHPHSWPNSDQALIIYDFDNSTGAISNAINVGPTAQTVGPYDIIFSPNDQRIFISRYFGGIYYIDLSSGIANSIAASYSTTGIGSPSNSAIEIGPSGKLYFIDKTSGSLMRINENLDSATTFSATAVPGTAGHGIAGLPTMYIPPVEVPVIQTIDPICYNADTVDLATIWHCAGTNTELIPHTYSGAGIIDADKGIFDPSIAGVGVHKIDFYNTACASNSDKVYITVMNDSTCSVTSVENILTNKTAIYPNPADDVINVGANVSIQIYSPNGQLVLESKSSRTSVSELKSGLYHVVITDRSGNSYTEKMIKN